MVNKTHLIQKNISDPSEAISAFNQSVGDRIPIVLVPAPRLCCSCCFTVPSGTNSVIETCGEDTNRDELAEAGLQCAPYWTSVAYMVTPQAITYNAPVKKCPTKDDVMVDCDLSLVVHIGSRGQPRMVKDFIYKLGARRFNEYLSAACDEGLRQLVRDTNLDDVYELRGGSGQEGPERLLSELAATFEPYGVIFKRAAITDVHLDHDLIRILQGTTEFEAKIKEVAKEHSLKIQEIHHAHDQKLATKERDYERRIQDSVNDQKVAKVDRKKEEVDSESNRQVKVKNAEENAQILLKRAQADLDVVIAQAQQQNQMLLAGVESSCSQKRIAANQTAKTRIADAEADLSAAQNRALAVLAGAKAEGDASSKLKIVRMHKLKMAQMEVSENIAKRSKIVISGETGEKFISQMINFSTEL